MSNSKGVSVVVISSREDHQEAINTALRDAGHAAHCQRINTTADLAQAMATYAPELVVLFDTGEPVDIERATNHCNAGAAQTPCLLVRQSVDESNIATTMRMGMRDVVSLENIERLQAVASRELRTCRLERALERVMNSANQFKNELHSLKQVSVEAIADVQEGIIVNVNPAWVELFGYQDESHLIGQPMMEFCGVADQPALKGGIVACQRGKWQDDQLNVSGVRPDGEEFRVAFCLENVEYDGEPAVRMLVKPEAAEARTPVSLIEKALQRDQNTGFYNRQHFLECANERLTLPPEGGVRALAYIRIDRFSRAARDIGLLGTESIIGQFSKVLKDYVQQNDIYGRFGGTMFVIMLERGNMADAEAWAAELLKAVEAAVFENDSRSTVLTCSVGLVEADAADSTLSGLLSESEQACRAARQKGGNTVQISEASGAAKQVRQDDSIWIPRIRGALMENRFRLEHQPIAGLNSEIGDAYDILVRMLDEEGNTILPSEFMPAAERTGMSKSIDRWVIGASFSFCTTNTTELLFVRLSRDSLLDDTLTDWLQAQLQRHRVAPSRICFEIDEAIVVQHLLQTQQLAEQLRGIGFKFAVEHVGRGADAAQVLTRVGMEIAKIDGSLMQGLHKNAETQARVAELVDIAREAGIETLAERVQDANTMAVLWQLGISYIQGNYVHRREIVLEDTSQSTITTRALQLQA